MFGPQLPLTRKLWVTLFETLQIKWEVKYFIKKSSCVFFPACVVYSCVFIIGRLNYYCIGKYPAYICIFLHESADDYITLQWTNEHSPLEKYISHTLFSKGLKSLWYWEMVLTGLLLPISSSRSQGVPTFAPPCKLVRDSSDRMRVPRSTTIFCTLSKSDSVVLITWSPSGYISARPECPDVPSSSCLLIKMWQLTKTHGVTENEPKVHIIRYITIALYSRKLQKQNFQKKSLDY